MPQSSDLGCGDCQRDPPAFDVVHTVFSYRWPLDRLITGLKYHQQWHLARLFGELLACDPVIADSHVDYLVPMPLHPRRLRQRGYNQALEIARHVSRITQIPVIKNVCRRKRDTLPQTQCQGKQRRQNVKTAFTANGTVTGLRLAIVDDVVTTGSTANELAKVLKQAGADHVEVWCIARASGDYN